MPLLTFPPNPTNGTLYPTIPAPGQNQYRYDATSQTWVLEGTATAVAPGCYGDAYNVPTFCVDAQGRITSAVNVPIAVTGGTVTDITAGTGLTGGTITTSGTIDLDTSFTDSLYLSLAGGTITGNLSVTGSLDASGLTYPAVDGVAGEVLTTDGAGNLSWSGNSVSTLQQVTDLGATTTRSITTGGVTSQGNVIVESFTTSPANRFDLIYDPAGANSMVTRINVNGITLGYGTANAELRFLGTSTGDWVGFKSPGTFSGQTVWSLPPADGTAGQVLTTNGSGILSWGGGSVGTLQQVTNAGSTTTNTITVSRATGGTGLSVINTASGRQTDISSDGINVSNGGIQLQTGGLPGVNITGFGTPSITVFGGGFLSMGTGTTLFQETVNINSNTGTILARDIPGTLNTSISPSGLSFVFGGQQIGYWGNGVSPNIISGQGTTLQLGTGTISAFTPTITLQGSSGKAAINALVGTATLTVGGTIRSDTVTTTGNFQISRAGIAVGLLSDTGSYLPDLQIAGIDYPTSDGTNKQVLSTNGAGTLGWLTTAEVVAVPGSSAAGGAANQIAFGGGFLYWFDPTGGQWLRVAGATF
jgi:hypothetical protein